MGRIIERNCIVCDKPFMAKLAKVAKGGGLCCSLSCRGKRARAGLPKHHGRTPTHGDCNSPLYRVWSSMKKRCGYERTPSYARYGGRGITVCIEWRDSYPAFRRWAIESGYKTGLSIDRIDNDGNYEPSNCRWATLIQQARNRTNNRKFTVGGAELRIADMCGITGLSKSAMTKRVNKLPAELAVGIPKLPNGKWDRLSRAVRLWLDSGAPSALQSAPQGGKEGEV